MIIIFYSLLFICGLVAGSFLNVVIIRLHSGEKIGLSRSHCPYCHKKLQWLDLLPLLSFAVLWGRCRYCRQKISWQYPLVELSGGLLFLIVTYNLVDWLSPALLLGNIGLFWLWFRNIVFGLILLIIFIYDLRWYLILDKVTLPAMAIAIVVNLVLGWLAWSMVNWSAMFLGAAIGFGWFAGQFFLSRGKWVGGGDIRMGVLMGLMLGWPMVILALFLAYSAGAIVGLILIYSGKKNRKSQLPFGTFLAVATFIALLWGEVIVNWYLNLL